MEWFLFCVFLVLLLQFDLCSTMESLNAAVGGTTSMRGESVVEEEEESEG